MFAIFVCLWHEHQELSAIVESVEIAFEYIAIYKTQNNIREDDETIEIVVGLQSMQSDRFHGFIISPVLFWSPDTNRGYIIK
jgi:hypothetical protein